MLDILASMALTSIAFLCVGALIRFGARDGAERRRLAWGAAAWFFGVAGLAASGVFALPTGLGPSAIGAAVAAPILVGAIALARSRSVRQFALRIPLEWLVGVHVGRFLGGFFLALHAAGRLPPTFATTAGWGDVFVAATALPLVWAIHRRVTGWRSLALAWNALALLDLVAAIALGVGSAPESPLRFLFESPDSGAMGTLPWLMVPGFFVPLYVLTHAAIFVQLATSVANERTPLRSVPLSSH